MKKQVRLLGFAAILFITTHTKAQVQFSGWFASNNSFTLSKRFEILFDAQFRSTDQWKELRTIILRPGLNLKVSKAVGLTLGYAFIPNRVMAFGQSELLPEHRIWQQALINHKVKNISVSHRLRFEERFIAEPELVNNELRTRKHNQAFRLRYFIRNMFPLVKQPTFTRGVFLALQNEVFLNTGNKSAVNGKTFDQNRLYLASGFRLSKKIDIELGYLNQYSVTASSFVNNHIIQLATYARL